MKKTFYLIILVSLLAAGCLETKEAWPATVSDSILGEVGWISAGDVVKQSQVQEIAGNSVKLNMAIMPYMDDTLAKDIKGQVQKTTTLSVDYDAVTSQLTSKLITLRLVLPSGISLPSSIVNSFIESQIQTIASQNNIRDFHNTGKKSITLDNGKNVDLTIFKGKISEDFGTADIKGMLSSWSDSGSTIIVFGIMPEADIIIKPENEEALTIKIDSEKESTKMVKLIQNVK